MHELPVLLSRCFPLLLAAVAANLPSALALGCFVCTSINNSTPQCEDTFGNVANFFSSNCQAARVGRAGLFPATECIKIKLLDPRDQASTTIRTCVVDNGGNSDNTEIGRSSHCGPMQKVMWQGVMMYGCVLTCNTDGCNGAARLQQRPLAVATMATGLLLLLLLSARLHQDFLY